MKNHGQVVSLFWSVADLIRDTLKRDKYQDVVLLFTVVSSSFRLWLPSG